MGAFIFFFLGFGHLLRKILSLAVETPARFRNVLSCRVSETRLYLDLELRSGPRASGRAKVELEAGSGKVFILRLVPAGNPAFVRQRTLKGLSATT